jgi:hypothetical protein
MHENRLPSEHFFLIDSSNLLISVITLHVFLFRNSTWLHEFEWGSICLLQFLQENIWSLQICFEAIALKIFIQIPPCFYLNNHFPSLPSFLCVCMYIYIYIYMCVCVWNNGTFMWKLYNWEFWVTVATKCLALTRCMNVNYLLGP